MQLINSINGSVDALDGLFSELLDITKIDTGGVEPRPTDFQLDEVFRKIRLHFEPIAFEKGLLLRVRGGHRHAYADPLLVERIVRNLTANAIRYTNDGGVLVCARTRGAKLLLQVWDTGVGIGETDRERVFDEFVQLHDAAASIDPHQRKGLGLGLSIVRRLASLMSAPLTLRSQRGRGTVFTLEVPQGRPRPAAAAPVRSSAPLGVTLDRRLVVMIEDDPAVKSGLEVLLKSWGASVIALRQPAGVSAVGAGGGTVDAQARPHHRRLPARVRPHRRRGDPRAARHARAVDPRDRGDRQRAVEPRARGRGTGLSPAAETSGAGEAARDDRVQAGVALAPGAPEPTRPCNSTRLVRQPHVERRKRLRLRDFQQALARKFEQRDEGHHHDL